MSVETQGLSLEDSQMVADLARSTPMLRELKPRRGMFQTEDAMYLTALGAMVETRMEVEARREAMFAKTEGWADDEINGYDEIIIGGGPAAAAYAAARVLSGQPRPLVITDTLGGKPFGKAMPGMPPAPWYRTNSSNRPGPAGLSSEESALNVIPGSPIQGSMLNMDKYQDNTVMAFVVRTALLRYADIRKGTAVNVEPGNRLRSYAVKLEDGGTVFADRVLDARGVGMPTQIQARGRQYLDFSDRILSPFDFADRFCQPFPFRDMHRIAVIGSGDTARVVIEALLGAGPSRHMSVPMLDWVEQIDWYGNNLPTDCFAWREQERTRYQDIGSFLRRPDDGRSRLRVFESNRAAPDEGLNEVYVSGRPYDAVVIAIGFKAPSVRDLFDSVEQNGDVGNLYANDGRTVIARQFSDRELYQIGVAANIGFDAGDPQSTQLIDNNRVALFRNLPRVVRLAMRLKSLQPTLEVTSAKALRTTRKLVALDGQGKKVRLGDRVKLYDSRGIEMVRGVVVKSRRGAVFAIKEDLSFTTDKPIGVTEDQLSRVVLQEPEAGQRKQSKAKKPIVGYDNNGEPVRQGDRVGYINYDGNEVTGTALIDDSAQYLAVEVGGEVVQLDNDEYNSLFVMS